MKVFLPAAGLFAFISLLLSALGAHYYSHMMTLEDYGNFDIAVHFQLIHSIALMALGLFGFVTRKSFRLLVLSGYLIILGIIFFAGNIYLTTIFHITTTKILTPIGGAVIILAWAIICVAGVYYYFRAVHAHDY